MHVEYVIGVFREGKTVPGLELHNISMYLMIFRLSLITTKITIIFCELFFACVFPTTMVRTCYNKSKSCVIIFLMDLFFPGFQSSAFFFTFFFQPHGAEESDSFQNTPTFRSGHIGKLQLVGETGNWSAWASHHKTSLFWWFTMEQGMGDDWMGIIFTPSDKRTKHTDTGSWERKSNKQRWWSSCFMNIHGFHELTWFTPKYLRWLRKCSDCGEHPCSLTATTIRHDAWKTFSTVFGAFATF